MDDEVAAGTEGAGAELTDVVSFVCGAEEKWGGGCSSWAERPGCFQDVFQGMELFGLGARMLSGCVLGAEMLSRCILGTGIIDFRGQDTFIMCFRI